MGWRRGLCLWLLVARSCALPLAITGCGRIGFDVTDLGGEHGDDGEGRDCPTTAILCEDFESGDLRQWPKIETNAQTNTVNVTTTRPRNGTYALEAIKPVSGTSGRAALGAPIGTHSTGQLAVREWIYSEDPIELFDLLLDISDAANANYTSVGGNTNGNWVVSEYRVAFGGQTMDQPSSVPTSMGAWHCIELLYTFASPPAVEVQVDGTTVLSAAGVTPLATFDHVHVGAVRGAPEGFHVFVDDVVVDTQPIGCCGDDD